MKSIREALSEVRNLDNHPLVKKAKQAHQRGVWNGNVDKDGNPIVHINGKPYTVEMEQVSENLRDLENMFGRGATDWRKIVKKNRRDLEAFQKGRKDLDRYLLRSCFHQVLAAIYQASCAHLRLA